MEEHRNIRFKELKAKLSERCAALPVGKHFRSAGHSAADLVFRPVKKIYGDDFLRKSRERMYIVHQQIPAY
jgi:hypothetical protein